jgi:hypothetical protein
MIRHRGERLVVGLVIRADRVAVIDSVSGLIVLGIVQFLVPLARVVAPRPKKLQIVFEFFPNAEVSVERVKAPVGPGDRGAVNLLAVLVRTLMTEKGVVAID